MLKKMHKKEIDINKMKRAERSFINVKKKKKTSITEHRLSCKLISRVTASVDNNSAQFPPSSRSTIDIKTRDSSGRVCLKIPEKRKW